MKSKLLNLALAVSASFALTSCGNEDLYDPSKSEAAWKEEYGAKFIAQYGSFGADHSWDASSLSPYYSAATRAGNNPTVSGDKDEDYYYVESDILEWLTTNLPEENKEGIKHGKKISMQVPNNPFTIVPIYQGKAGLVWDLHIVIGTDENQEDINFWHKSDGIQVPGNKGEWQNLGESETTVDASAVRSKQYTFDFSDRAGEMMYFYLEITRTGMAGSFGNIGDRLSSLNEKMVYLDCSDAVNNLGKNKVMVIGCEDSSTQKSDEDMNDIVFLVYGDPNVPGKVEITTDKVVETKTKRYMIEDLGSTDDFDFNDIVVDVMDVTTKKLTITNGTISKTEIIQEESGQKAIIRHLGGVIPFTLKIGDTTFEEIPGQIGVDPKIEKTITGWVPDQNNITVKVKGQNNGEVYTVEFPEDGAIPMIIATDPDVEWMEERTAITNTWFNGLRKQ